MTNFAPALQTLVGRKVHIKLRVESETVRGIQPFDLECLIQEVMSDSFVGEKDGNAIYVPFHAIAYVSAADED